MAEDFIANRKIRINERVTHDRATIEGITFDNCTILGPAILVPDAASDFDAPTFGGPPSAWLWEIAPGRSKVAGIIVVRNCTFRGCVFRNIGIAGSSALLDKFRADIEVDPSDIDSLSRGHLDERPEE